MARTKRWTWSNHSNGIAQVKISSWKYFADFIHDEMQDYNSYIWRGQKCDTWQLESTFDRLVRDAKVPDTRHSDFLSKHLDAFKYAVRGRRGSNPPIINDENEWWALGQHHGLATPLLDWTTSPFVAAFFAFIETAEPQTRFRAIYALHQPTIERLSKDKARLANIERKERVNAAKNSLSRMLLDYEIKLEASFIRPLSDENHRLMNQGGLFSRTPTGKTLEQWVQEHCSEGESGTIIKILIPNQSRENCLRNLNRMNINHLSLFADLFGASRFCNLFSEISRY